MTFRQFAFRNVTRNKRLYAAYFLSSLFMVMAFFTFSIFAFHPTLSGDGMNSSVMQGMAISGGIIYIFSFFFILYSMSSFLQSRKKEFGLLMIQGMSMKQIRKMVFMENMIIGSAATAGGIVLGIVFAKAILLGAENVLIIEEQLNFYVPGQAILLTACSFLSLFFVISVFVTYILRSNKLIDLLKGDKKSKGEPKSHWIFALLAVLLLGGGYAGALIPKGMGVLVVMLPVIIVVSIGTYLLFTQLSVFVINRFKKNESFFWRNSNMILFSDLSFRMKDNARTFFMVAMVSTVAFSAIGALVGFQTAFVESAINGAPNSFTYETDEEGDKNIELINQVLREEKIEAKQEVTTLALYDINDSVTMVAKESDFNRFALLIGEEPVEVPAGESVVVKYTGNISGRGDELLDKNIEFQTGEILKTGKVISSRALPDPLGYYLISDEDYAKLPEPRFQNFFYAWQTTSGADKEFAAAEKLARELDPWRFEAKEYVEYEIMKSYGPILFVGLFIGLIFFVSAGSFLYFRLYTDLDEDKKKFKAVAKIGLSENELKRVLSKQIMILFFIPIIAALLHGAIALTALSNMLEYNILAESALVLAVFLAIQVLYYFIVRHFYIKQVKSHVFQ